MPLSLKIGPQVAWKVVTEIEFIITMVRLLNISPETSFNILSLFQGVLGNYQITLINLKSVTIDEGDDDFDKLTFQFSIEGVERSCSNLVRDKLTIFYTKGTNWSYSVKYE